MSDKQIWKPHVTVAAIIEQNRRYLLVEERTDNGKRFNQPAGHLEPGETLIEAVIRETREETGYEFNPTALIGIYQWSNSDGEHFLRFAFSGQGIEPKMLTKLDEGIISIHWLFWDEIKNLHHYWRSPLVGQVITDYQQGIKYPKNIISHID